MEIKMRGLLQEVSRSFPLFHLGHCPSGAALPPHDICTNFSFRGSRHLGQRPAPRAGRCELYQGSGLSDTARKLPDRADVWKQPKNVFLALPSNYQLC